MGKPDSPLSVQLPGDCWRDGRELKAPPACVGTARGQKAQPREPGTLEHHRSQAAAGELGRAD